MIKLLRRNMRTYYWGLIIVIIGAIYLQVTADLKLPDYLSKILAVLIYNTSDSKQEIRKNGLLMLGYASLSTVCTVIVGFIAAKIAAGFSHDTRESIYKKVQSFSMEEIDRFSTSSLITRSTNDVTQVQMAVIMSLRMAISAPIMAVKSILKVQAKSTELSLIVLIAVIFLISFVITIFMIVIPKFKKIQGLTDKLNLVTRENLTGLRVVRANGAQEIEMDKFSDVNNATTKINIFVNRIMSLMQPGMMLVMNFTSLSIIWVGAYLVDSNKMGLEDVFAFQQYTMMLVMSFMQLTMIAIMFPRGSVSAKRINEILETQVNIVNPSIPKNSIENKGNVEFKNVYFSYPNAKEPVLENISFTAKAGQTVAFIGSTGSGKSTVINLIPRFFDVSQGEILIDGINIKDYTQEDLREKIGYIPQKGILFSGTIESNLKYGKTYATDDEISEALEIAQAQEFVSKLELGIKNPISQGGSNVSGGQKQRLSIARAIIKKPKIYIFDDSFSALDFKTDALLREALKEKMKNATKLIVAQRIGTILNADKIIVLEQGKIVGMGTHKELLDNCEVYQEIAYSQLSKEELTNG